MTETANPESSISLIGTTPFKLFPTQSQTSQI